MSALSGDEELLGRLSVLVVEDDPLVLTQIKGLLAPAVQAVFTAEGGRQGVFEFARRKPDVVISDVLMPGMDGIELAQAVRGITPDVPVLLVTSLDDPAMLRRALPLGINEYLPKPLTPEALFDALRRMARTLDTRHELDRQRRLNEKMLEAAPNPTALVSTATGLVQVCNPRAQRLGFAPDAPCPADLVPEDLLAALRQVDDRAPAACRLDCSREISGQGRHWLLHWSPVGPELVLLSLADITSRKAAEDALREERRRLADVIYGTGVGTWEWNVQTGETVFNERWAEIVGYTLKELAPVSITTWEGLVHPDDLGLSNTLLERHFAGETERYICECRMRHKDGHWVWVLDRGRVISRAADGTPLRMSGTHADISERKKMEQFREDVERITRHDLKTPLTAFTALPDLLMEDANLTEEQREYLCIIRDAGVRMLNMINLSLELFKMETGAYQLPPTVLDLRRTLDQALSEVRTLGRHMRVGVEFSAAQELPGGLPVRGDESLCVSLFDNLLKNAVEASPQGGVVEVRLEAGPGEARLTIRNQGEVPEDIRASFFEKYATSGKHGGTGLGTYSALLVARAHGGDVLLDTAEPGRTSVQVRLPLVASA